MLISPSGWAFYIKIRREEDGIGLRPNPVAFAGKSDKLLPKADKPGRQSGYGA
jgi:hypothetical protein